MKRIYYISGALLYRDGKNLRSVKATYLLVGSWILWVTCLGRFKWQRKVNAILCDMPNNQNAYTFDTWITVSNLTTYKARSKSVGGYVCITWIALAASLNTLRPGDPYRAKSGFIVNWSIETKRSWNSNMNKKKTFKKIDIKMSFENGGRLVLTSGNWYSDWNNADLY